MLTTLLFRDLCFNIFKANRPHPLYSSALKTRADGSTSDAYFIYTHVNGAVPVTAVT